jgi:hypothetical protein
LKKISEASSEYKSNLKQLFFDATHEKKFFSDVADSAKTKITGNKG